MRLADILSGIASGVGVAVLIWIARRISVIGNKFDRFMGEHMWLLATTLWTRDNVMLIMKRLDMPINNEPPKDLPRG